MPWRQLSRFRPGPLRDASAGPRRAHPLPKMHDFFVERVRMDFDREVPFQMGGDVIGMRRSVEFDLAEESVQLVDWRQLSRMVRV